MTRPPGTPPPPEPAWPAWDGDAVLADLDPDLAGLDPAALAGRDEPTDAELNGEYPLDDDDGGGDDGALLAALAAGPGAAFAHGGPIETLAPSGTVAGPGWRVDQSEPGILTWTLPHGRSYTAQADAYPI